MSFSFDRPGTDHWGEQWQGYLTENNEPVALFKWMDNKGYIHKHYSLPRTPTFLDFCRQISFATYNYELPFLYRYTLGACRHNPCCTLVRRDLLGLRTPNEHSLGDYSCPLNESPRLPPVSNREATMASWRLARYNVIMFYIVEVLRTFIYVFSDSWTLTWFGSCRSWKRSHDNCPEGDLKETYDKFFNLAFNQEFERRYKECSALPTGV